VNDVLPFVGFGGADWQAASTCRVSTTGHFVQRNYVGIGPCTVQVE